MKDVVGDYYEKQDELKKILCDVGEQCHPEYATILSIYLSSCLSLCKSIYFINLQANW